MTLRLTDLAPSFLKRAEPDEWLCEGVSKIDADGVMFLCPKCFKAKGGPVGTHSIICWQPNVPQDTSPTGGRWTMVGTGFNDLSLVAGSNSVLLEGGCAAHFFVEDGKIREC